MTTDPSLLRVQQGSIIWVSVAIHSTVTKRRPALVISANDEIILDRPIAVVPITTTFTLPPPCTHVELPWSPNGHTSTRLRRRSAAVCDVVRRVLPSEVELVGQLPTRHLLRVLKQIQELNEDSHQ